jgi:tetratricopeptide (TPR) repeat protein
LFRDIGDIEAAIVSMDRAIACLQSGDSGGTDDADSRRLRSELADCWGIKGGILRRAGRLDEALQAYKAGLSFETDDSYNLTNALTLELVIAPGRLRDLEQRIADARAEVERQVPLRANQWWAWADLGLLELLSGREDRALAAYSHFAAAGARASDYDSTISVLEQLSAKFNGLNEAVCVSLDRAIAFLKRQRP